MQRYRKMELILALSIFLIITINPQISYASDVVPGLGYSSKPFSVNEYNVTKVIEKAEDLGYAVEIQTSPGVCVDEEGVQYENCLGRIRISQPTYEYINVNNSFEFSNSKKRMGVINKSMGIGVITDDLEFQAEPPYPGSDPYLFVAGFKSTNDNLTTEQISEIIVNELLLLGILDEPIAIEFGEGYTPPVPSSGSNFGNVNFQDKEILNLLYYFVVIIIIIVVIICLIKKRHKT